MPLKGVKPISLSELKSREQADNAGVRKGRVSGGTNLSAREKVNTVELRKTLEEALRSRNERSPGRSPEKKPKNVIQPGEAIKF
jgi:hypothetical protein